MDTIKVNLKSRVLTKQKNCHIQYVHYIFGQIQSSFRPPHLTHHPQAKLHLEVSEL